MRTEFQHYSDERTIFTINETILPNLNDGVVLNNEFYRVIDENCICPQDGVVYVTVRLNEELRNLNEYP